MKCIIFYNPLSKRGNGFFSARLFGDRHPDWEITYKDMTKVSDAQSELDTIPNDAKIVFTGGDGTLNLVSNALRKLKLEREIYYYPAGTGNDFMNDLGIKGETEPVLLNDYIKTLPTVKVKGKTMYFLNGIGYGLDGFCCAENDRLNEKGKCRSYTLIALFGLLGQYRPVNAKSTVDGETRTYHKVWMAPTMFGSFFGGGVNIAPKQSRFSEEHTVTNIMIHDVGRIRAMMLFLSVCKGEGDKHPEYLDYRTGHHIKVEYESPRPFQVDGETYNHVTEYEVDYE